MRKHLLYVLLLVFVIALLLCTACAGSLSNGTENYELKNSDTESSNINAQKSSVSDLSPVSFVVTSPNNDAADKSDYQVICESRTYGEVTPWQENLNIENRAKYFDSKYAYWFDNDGNLLSRVLIDISNQTLTRTLTEEEAVALAASEISFYVKSFDSSRKELEVKRNEESFTPWVIEFSRRDNDGFIYEAYKAVIDSYGDVCLLTISQNQISDAKCSLSSETAIEQAKLAAANYIANTNDVKEAVNSNKVVIVNQEMYAENGNKIYSFTLNGFEVGSSIYEHSLFVGINALTGEVMHISQCR